MGQNVGFRSEIAQLRKQVKELRELAHDAVGPTVAWAAEYQSRYQLDDLHPEHQKLIDRLTAAANQTASVRDEV